ncbi:MAG: hypothetical protein NZ874_09415 [Fimbriimonadales bacterium]|nr:hypothetical protein [Fimbriimonadales bacterium]
MRKEGYCAFGAAQTASAVRALQAQMDTLCPSDLRSLETALAHAHRLQTCLTLFRACYPKSRVRLWKHRLRRVIRALNAQRDLTRLIKWAESLAPPREYTAGVRRAALRLRQRADALAQTLQHAWARWQASRAPNEILGLSRRWQESFADEPPDVAYATRQWTLFHREQTSALATDSAQSLEVRCGRLRALLEGGTLLQPLLPDCTPCAEASSLYAALEQQRFLRSARATLQTLLEQEPAMQLRLAGHLRSFTRVRNGMEWLLTQLEHLPAWQEDEV